MGDRGQWEHAVQYAYDAAGINTLSGSLEKSVHKLLRSTIDDHGYWRSLRIDELATELHLAGFQAVTIHDISSKVAAAYKSAAALPGVCTRVKEKRLARAW